jgi:large subunit ribosomal protein L22
MTGLKTNERPGTRAQLRHCRMSAYKARQVLDLIRGVELERAGEILQYCDREAAAVIGKVVASAAANAEQNDQLNKEELYISACYADEGTTMKRWRPRARGRAGRIRKRTCHITVIVSRLPEGEIERRRARAALEAADRRARRVAGTRRARRVAAESTGADVSDVAGDTDDGSETADVSDHDAADALESADTDESGEQDENDEVTAEEEAADAVEPADGADGEAVSSAESDAESGGEGEDAGEDE